MAYYSGSLRILSPALVQLAVRPQSLENRNHPTLAVAPNCVKRPPIPCYIYASVTTHPAFQCVIIKDGVGVIFQKKRKASINFIL